MEETKIWSIDGNGKSAKQLDTTNRMETEGLLEDILAATPEMLEDGLQLVGRQTSTASGPLDLLGVDTDGRLVVYELKRGTLNREAVAQVIDYASFLNSLEIHALVEHISSRSGSGGIQKIENFEEWYDDTGLAESIESLTPPRMVLVGLGVDDATKRMVDYLASSGTNISLLTFYGFADSEGKTLLARQAEVNTADTISSMRSSVGKNAAEQRRIKFDEHATEMDVKELLDAARGMFESQFKSQFLDAKPSIRRMHFNRDKESYLFIDLDKSEGKNCIKLGFHPVAVDLALYEFGQLQNKDIPFQQDKARSKPTDKVDYEVKFPIYSVEEWNAHKKQLTTLTQAVYKAYQKAN